MVDLQKPCVKCGVVDRYKNGNCRACSRNRKPSMECLQKPCVKCNAVGRGKHGECKTCKKIRMSKYRQSAEGREKLRALGRKYREAAGYKEKKRDIDRNRNRTEAGREYTRVAKIKFRKLQFEFSLQNQQKVIEQCQQKST